MPKTRELTDFERDEIIDLWKADFFTRDIEKVLGHSQKTISNIIIKVKKDQNIAIEELTDKFNKSLTILISTSTVRNYLHQEGYFGRVAKKKPFISESNRKK